VFPYSNEVHEPEFLKGKRVLAFAGIARPEAFRKTLTGVGADLVYFKGFKDHYKFKRDEIKALIQIKEKRGADYLVTTEKDWMRIASFASICPDIAYLSIQFTLLSGKDKFFRMIKDEIGVE
jgi:tetraacyldisaccharide 4'-kinase